MESWKLFTEGIIQFMKIAVLKHRQSVFVNYLHFKSLIKMEPQKWNAKEMMQGVTFSI